MPAFWALSPTGTLLKLGQVMLWVVVRRVGKAGANCSHKGSNQLLQLSTEPGWFALWALKSQPGTIQPRGAGHTAQRHLPQGPTRLGLEQQGLWAWCRGLQTGILDRREKLGDSLSSFSLYCNNEPDQK